MKSLSRQLTESVSDEATQHRSKFLTVSELREVSKKYHEDIRRTVETETTEDIKSQILKYVETNDKKLLDSIFDAIRANTKLSKVVDSHNHMIRRVYRGINTTDDLTESMIKDTELHSEYTATTRDKSVAKSYAKGDSEAFDKADDTNHAFMIEYGVQPDSVFLDIDLFKPILDKDIESEIIISPRLAESIAVTKLKIN